MDEHTDKEACVESVVASSKVITGEHVVASGDGEKSKVFVEPIASQDRACNGVDEIVEVSGSNNCVDGVCISDSGDRGNVNEEALLACGESNEVALEWDGKTLDGGGGTDGDLGLQQSRDSDTVPSKLGGEEDGGGSSTVAKSEEEGKSLEYASRDGGGCSVVTETKEEGKLAEDGAKDCEANSGGGGGPDVADSISTGDVRVVEVDPQIVGAGSEIRVSTDEETEVMVKEVAVIMEEKSLGEELVKECVDSGALNVTEDVNSQEVEPSKSEVHDQRDESGVGDSSTKATQSTNVVVEKSVTVEEAKKPDGVEGNLNLDSETQNVGVTHDEVMNSCTETIVTMSSTILEDSGVNAQVVNEEATILVNSDGTPDGDNMDNMEVNTSNSARDSVTLCRSLDLQNQVTCEGKTAPVDQNDITCPNIEGMDTDAFDENFCFSVEELQATVETASWSTENHCNAFADSQSSQEQTQVIVGGDFAATEHNVPPNSEDHQKLLTEECSDQNMVHAATHIHSDVVSDIGVGKQVADGQHNGMLKEQMIPASEQQVKDQTVNGSSENFETSCESAHAIVRDEFTGMDHTILFDANNGISNNVALDGRYSSSGKDQNPKAEVLEGAEKDMKLRPGQGLDKTGVSDAAKIDSTLGQVMDVQEVDQLGVVEEKVAGRKSGPETVKGSTKSDNQFVDGGEIAKTGNDEHLRSENEGTASIEGDQYYKGEGDLDNDMALDLSEIDTNADQETAVEEEEDDDDEQAEDMDTDTEHQMTVDGKSAKQAASKPESSIRTHQANYLLPPDDEAQFSVSDLVWGKVRSHPWWPGQIFDPSDASEKAMKYHKKDCFFVAYFGDRTFAWNDASLLKPFGSHFSQVEKQSNSEAFQNAVDCALEEVSRRVEFGLACSCMPKDSYDNVKMQMVENAGIRDESSTREDKDKSMGANLFSPDKLVEYMKALAQSPSGGANRLELVIAKSQLLAFYRLKGYSELPEFQFCGGLLEDTLGFENEDIAHASAKVGQEISQTQRGSYHKRKHNLKESIYPRKKERSVSELMVEPWESVDEEIRTDGKADGKLVSSGKKMKGSDFFGDESAAPEGRKTISVAKVSTTAASSPKPSFKIGECIRRVASQMTGSPSILKSNNQKLEGSTDGLIGDGTDFQHSEDAEIRKMADPTECSSLEELLSQLYWAARDPLKGYSFFNIVISFFSDFRNSVTMEQREKIVASRKVSNSGGGIPETFEFEDIMSDTYWTDRVIENGSEEQPSRKSRKRDIFEPVEPDKSFKRSNSRKRYSDTAYDQTPQKPAGYVDENAPAELVMHFPVVDSVPSEISLNKMFRRFGPLKELETEIDRDTNRARVVFKKCSDAEAAYGSAPKFSIFGQTHVNYQLNYTITVPFKTLPIATTQGIDDDATLFLEF